MTLRLGSKPGALTIMIGEEALLCFLFVVVYVCCCYLLMISVDYYTYIYVYSVHTYIYIYTLYVVIVGEEALLSRSRVSARLNSGRSVKLAPRVASTYIVDNV